MSAWTADQPDGEIFDVTFSLDDIAEANAATDEPRAIKALVKVSELA